MGSNKAKALRPELSSPDKENQPSTAIPLDLPQGTPNIQNQTTAVEAICRDTPTIHVREVKSNQ